jgi:hypothetical protein
MALKEFYSKERARTMIWKMPVITLPDKIRNLPKGEREKVLACYAPEIGLTLEKYPEQIENGLLKVASSIQGEIRGPSVILGGVENLVVLEGLHDFVFGVNEIGDYSGGKSKPVFAHVYELASVPNGERLAEYRKFLRNLQIMKKADL